MPDITQQEWLEEQIARHMIDHTVANDWLSLAVHIANALPSSPQGLAAKQMMEVLGYLAGVFNNLGAGRIAKEALLAAQKAGLAA